MILWRLTRAATPMDYDKTSLPDSYAACRELLRVLKPGGLVFVRNSFKGRLDSVRYCDFFPSARAVDNARLPDMAGLTAGFEAAGFERVAHRIVLQTVDRSMHDHYQRMRLKPVSTLQLISKEEFEQGIEAMRRAAEAEVQPTPVTEDIDLLVFQKRLGQQEHT